MVVVSFEKVADSMVPIIYKRGVRTRRGVANTVPGLPRSSAAAGSPQL